MGTKSTLSFLLFGLFFAGLVGVSDTAGAHSPNPRLTPGATCSSSDPDFNRVDYPSQVELCTRHVTTQMKLQIAANYGGIPQSQWRLYEFDHLIPLCAGGSNALTNVWPQPIDEAHEKDQLEDEICHGLREGSMNQAEAVQKVQAWIHGHPL